MLCPFFCLITVCTGITQSIKEPFNFNKKLFNVDNSDLPRYIQQNKRLLIKNFLSPSENTKLDSGASLTFAV